MKNTMVGVDLPKEVIQVCTYTNKKVRSFEADGRGIVASIELLGSLIVSSIVFNCIGVIVLAQT